MSDEGILGKLILNISTLLPDLPPHSAPPGPGLASPSLWKPPRICFLLALLISQSSFTRHGIRAHPWPAN